MLLCEFDLIGVSELMFGKPITTEKKASETYEQFEDRTWKEKVRVNADGQCYLNPFALKNALESAGKWRKDKIKGEGQSTYTKRFVSGILVMEKLMLFKSNGKPMTSEKDVTKTVLTCLLKIKDVRPEPLFVPSDGKRGGPKRVFRIFPTVSDWRTHGVIQVFDEKISEKILFEHLVTAGKFVGFGAMRVENGGINGRFIVENFKATEVPD